MDLTYFKRYRMEIDLTGQDSSFSEVKLPADYRFLPWSESLLDAFAEAKYRSFRGELDSNVFPCLGELAGCKRLMTEISHKSGFLPGATWLMTYEPAGRQEPEYCGTVQGIRSEAGLGAVQNLGITPAHRDRGLGTDLLFQALDGFRRAGLSRVYLEVTAQNEGAIRLYHRLGFATVRTVFKVAEEAHA